MEPRSLNKDRFFADLGYAPHDGQRAIHFSAAPRRIVACGVRWGKTRCAAMEGLAAAMQPAERSMGWIVAPTYDLADKVFREMVVIVAEHLRHHIITMKESEKRIVIRNMAGGLSEIRGKSADNPVSLLGEGLDWLIIDEAARLKPTIWEGHLSQRLIDKKGWALMISTPRGKGWFYDLFRLGQGKDPSCASWNCPSWSNPYLDAALIEEERGRLPERTFMQEYGGHFLEGSGSVFRNVRDVATVEFQAPIPEKSYYAGLDLARFEDYTVLVIMNDKREVVFVDRFTKLDWNLQLNRIRTATKRYGSARILLDSTGQGEPIYETLLHAGCSVEGYTFTQKSKAALIDNLSLMFERKKIKLPKPDLWPDGIDELESFQYSITDHGSVRSSAPAGQHDDCVIALGLAAWQVRPARPEPGITVGWITKSGKIAMRSTHDWDNDDDDGGSHVSPWDDDDDDCYVNPRSNQIYGGDPNQRLYTEDDDDDDGMNFLKRMLLS